MQDGGGSIDSKELKDLMASVGQNPTDDELAEMIRIADADGTGASCPNTVDELRMNETSQLCTERSLSMPSLCCTVARRRHRFCRVRDANGA